jgi:hypothetical protein
LTTGRVENLLSVTQEWCVDHSSFIDKDPSLLGGGFIHATRPRNLVVGWSKRGAHDLNLCRVDARSRTKA